MAHHPSHVGEGPIQTVDISPLLTEASDSLADLELLRAGQALVRALHTLGFVKVTGHGIEKHEIETALAWSKKLFDLPYEDKMKAPHPPGNMPHRGYSGIGREKVIPQQM